MGKASPAKKCGARETIRTEKIVKQLPQEMRHQRRQATSDELQLLKDLYDDLVNDGDQVMPVYNWYRKQRREKEKLPTGLSGNDEIFACSTFKGLPPKFKLAWLVENTDMDDADVLKIESKHPQNIDNLITCGCQFSFKSKLAVCLRSSLLLTRFLVQRHEECGSRLAKIKAKKAINADGSIKWSALQSYRLVVRTDDPKMIARIIHVGGAEVSIPDGLHLPVADLVEGNDDWLCALSRKPLQDDKLHQFFQAGEIGPYAMKSLTNNKQIEEYATQIAATHTNAVSEARGSVAMGSDDLLTGLSKQIDQRHAGLLAAAREKSKKLMKEDQQSRTIAVPVAQAPVGAGDGSGQVGDVAALPVGEI